MSRISRLVASVTERWFGYFPDRLFHLKDDILSMEALQWPAFTSDEFRAQHGALADYWNETAPRHGIRLKMEGEWPIEQFQWHKQEDELWDAFRKLGVEQILDRWAIEETRKPRRKWPGDLYQPPPPHSPENERQFLAYTLAGFIRCYAIELPALIREDIESNEEQRGEEGRYSRDVSVSLLR